VSGGAASAVMARKGIGSGRRGSTTPDAEQHDFHGIDEDRYIEPEREALDVEEVVLELLPGVLDRCAVAAADRRVASDARLHAEALPEKGDFALEPLDEDGALGAGADEAHLADEHVPELRQLIDAGPAEEAADARDARIVLGRPRGAERLRVGAHRAKLLDREAAPSLARADLRVEHRAARVELD